MGFKQDPPVRRRTADRHPIPLALRIGSAVIIVALLLGFAMLRPACAGLTEQRPAGGEAAPYTSPYTWSNLDRADGRYAYYENGVLASQIGIDVSEHQGAIDWTAVADDGIDFAIVRIGGRGTTEGGLYEDARFEANYEGARSSGIAVGAYFFSQAASVEEAEQEADFVISLIAGRRLELPIVFDHETVAGSGRANDVDDSVISACAKAFCTRIEAAGYSTMIYGNASDLSRYRPSDIGSRPVWLAQYDVAAPTAQFDFSVWQYSNGGSVAGVSTAVDMNILFLTAPQRVE